MSTPVYVEVAELMENFTIEEVLDNLISYCRNNDMEFESESLQAALDEIEAGERDADEESEDE
jgi:hypothetical protein